MSLVAVAALAQGCHRAKDLTGKVVKVDGSYARTCRDVTNADNGAMSAQCLDAHGQFHASTISAAACQADISNINGVLTCSH